MSGIENVSAIDFILIALVALLGLWCYKVGDNDYKYWRSSVDLSRRLREYAETLEKRVARMEDSYLKWINTRIDEKEKQ